MRRVEAAAAAAAAEALDHHLTSIAEGDREGRESASLRSTPFAQSISVDEKEKSEYFFLLIFFCERHFFDFFFVSFYHFFILFLAITVEIKCIY